ncbi:NUDIX hydrolase [Microbacterium sp. ASV81]|uniref:NUDIX domain-containing protein n=1 Tax=Microbacterium capsulatum TaxID=3041921 RepID=A0ABU0XAZ5_9MICO|nr:NUDIX domain-containing protein [Microbacterium sp. ASV81]MDQ4212303.1 NUDIX domain-containing protein [Microbacterium sp. ASV81]
MISAEDDDLPVAGTAVILRDGDDGVEVLLLRRPDHGSFAGAWVFPGGALEPADRIEGAGEVEDACRAAVRETAEEVDLELERLAPLSCWVPPAGVPKRIRTWFFLAEDPGGEIAAAPGEVAETRWMSPSAALEAHGRGEIELWPPTWRTLHGLLDVRDVEQALTTAGEPPEFRTRRVPTAGGAIFHWDGDELAGAPAGARDRIVAEGLPWRYERS